MMALAGGTGERWTRPSASSRYSFFSWSWCRARWPNYSAHHRHVRLADARLQPVLAGARNYPGLLDWPVRPPADVDSLFASCVVRSLKFNLWL